jgi:large subunit ribosomal protein L3
VTKPIAGQFTRAGVEPAQFLREIRVSDGEYEVGSSITVDLFKAGDRVDVTGTSRGLGFAGGMKRHHFSGANKTHGQSDRWRAPGSLGQSSYPSRVFKGLRMAGRMGRERVTVLNLEVVKVIEGENLLLVRGAVPGHRGALVKVRSTNRGAR